MKFDYSNYKQFIDSLDLKTDPFNPSFEEMKDYIDISEDFDPINYPPDDPDKKDYIFKYIIPIMKHHAKENSAILIIDTYDSKIVITLFIDEIMILDDDFDLRNILIFASSFFISAIESNKLKLELFFNL